MKGRIVKIISNHCTVDDGTRQIVAKPRGTMRKAAAPLVGDYVEFEQVQDSFRLEKILPRKNRLLRPAVANVDQALIVTSCKDPDFSLRLLNRLIFLAVLAEVKPVICLTKLDLADEKEKERILGWMDQYKKAGYEVVITYPGSNDEDLKAVLKDRVSVLCGQSGAGKSSLLNRLDPEFKLATQEISKALGRGRHTTRHCELHPVAGGLTADTPGFSSLDFTRLDTSRLAEQIPDFQPYLGACRFKDCAHLSEPDCAIKQAVEEGKINKVLYEDYVAIMKGENSHA